MCLDELKISFTGCFLVGCSRKATNLPPWRQPRAKLWATGLFWSHHFCFKVIRCRHRWRWRWKDWDWDNIKCSQWKEIGKSYRDTAFITNVVLYLSQIWSCWNMLSCVSHAKRGCETQWVVLTPIRSVILKRLPSASTNHAFATDYTDTASVRAL